MAHGPALKSVPKPACWNGCAPKVAVNSSERPEAKVASVPAREPLTVSTPPPTVALPLGGVQSVLDHPLGSVEPANSSPTKGVRITSPLPACVTPAQLPGVPLLKSAAVVSVKVGAGNNVVKLFGGLGETGDVEGLPAGSVELTR